MSGTKAKNLALAAGSKIDSSGNVEANTLDTIDSLEFLRSNTDDTIAGTLSIQVTDGEALKLINTDASIGGGESLTFSMEYPNALASSTGWKHISRYSGGAYQLARNVDNAGYAEALTILESGNVGIGTASPTSILHIADGNNNAWIGDLNGASTMSLRMSDNPANPVEIEAYSDQMRFKTTPAGGSATTRLIIANNGYIGIGANSPSATLEIPSNGAWSSGISITNSGNAMNMVVDGATGHRLNIGSPSGVGRIRMDEGSNAYIELVSPSAVLLPRGNDSNRPGETYGTATEGQFRYNTGSDKLEYYNGIEWKEVGVYVPYSDYVSSGLQFMFDANRTECWVNGSNPQDFMGTYSITLNSVSNSYSTAGGARGLNFNDAGNMIVTGAVQGFPRTYEIWIYHDLADITSINWESYFDDASMEGHLIGKQGGSNIFSVYTSDGAASVIQGQVWQQFAISFTGTWTGTMYKNGSQVDTLSTGSRSIASPGSNLYVGGDAGGGESVEGHIALVRVYNRALSSTEILQNFNNDRSKFGI